MMLIDPHFQGAFSVVEQGPIAKVLTAISSCRPQASKDELGAIRRKKPTCQKYRHKDFLASQRFCW